MQIKTLFKTARCVTVEIRNGNIFETEHEYEIYVNGTYYGTTRRVITSIYNLKPDTEYTISIGGVQTQVKTDTEFVTLNVRDFGAKGDGVQNDTAFIQAAILACPKESRVLIPAGTYRVTSLFLKDDLRLELAEGAVLSAITDRTQFPILPGIIQSYDEKDDYNLGTWEGNPLSMFSGIITGINCKHVIIYGKGVIDGNASKDPDNWWYDAKTKRIAWRPRMIFLNRCKDVVVEGLTVQNSPSWNIHPYFSERLRFINLQVLNPADSPNTDGLDPESCRDLEIVGVYFSVGDDCIAVKAGKIYMGRKYKVPCQKIVIHQCCMRDGHGSITVGSEMAGGVKDMIVKNCLFLNTDRGLRIKTRRGRGQDAVIDRIHFENIRMDHVMTPFVINCFYYCDPDGHSEYVACKDALPVDERTPEIKELSFINIDASNCHVAAAYMYGLPEMKIRRVVMDGVHVTFADQAKKDQPAMMDGCEPCSKRGIFARNIKNLILHDVSVKGQEGPAFEFDNIDKLEKWMQED
jgi:polygalacturonase